MTSTIKPWIYLPVFIMTITMLPVSCKKDNNRPPDIPELLAPDNGLLGTFSDTLKWSCNDPDGDNVVYDVYFGKTNPPLFFKPNYKDNTLVLNDLDLDATYYFYLLAKDPAGAATKSTIYKLKVVYDLPSLTTDYSIGASANSATSGGKIISDGHIVITSKGVCWSTDHNPTIDDNKTNDGNGPDNFASLITGLSPTTLYYVRAYATNACGTSYGDELFFRSFSGSVADIDGNLYNTIIIGDQEWTVENLKVTKYRNGDPIPEVSGDAEWSILTSDAYCNMNNDENFSAIYGRLYNWQAVHDNRNIAPAGWHVASFEEWSTLVDYLGGEMIAGGKLKAAGTRYWQSPNTGATNETGFTAPGGGFRYDFGTYSPDLGTIGAWWSSSESDADYAFAVNLNYWDTPVNGGPILKNTGYSVRCLKDHSIPISKFNGESEPFLKDLDLIWRVDSKIRIFEDRRIESMELARYLVHHLI